MTEQLSFTSTPEIKLVVIDVDNTLLNSKHELSLRNEQTVKAVMASGVKVILATGKNYHACKDLIERLGIKDPGIFTQGLAVHRADGTVLREQHLDPDIARKVITFVEDRGLAVVAYSSGRLLARTSNPYVEEMHTKWREVKPEYVGPLQNMLGGTAINKLVMLSANDPRKIKAIRWQLGTQINGAARLMNGGVEHMLEVLPPGTSKGNTLKALLRDLQIDPQNVMAIGDGENDIEMLKLARIGIAVANAQQVLKDAADEITASHDEDGVAKAIEKYVITGPVMETAATATTDPASTPADEGSRPEDTLAAMAETPDAPDVTPQPETESKPEAPAEPAAPRPEDMVPGNDSEGDDD